MNAELLQALVAAPNRVVLHVSVDNGWHTSIYSHLKEGTTMLGGFADVQDNLELARLAISDLFSYIGINNGQGTTVQAAPPGEDSPQ